MRWLLIVVGLCIACADQGDLGAPPSSAQPLGLAPQPSLPMLPINPAVVEPQGTPDGTSSTELPADASQDVPELTIPVATDPEPPAPIIENPPDDPGYYDDPAAGGDPCAALTNKVSCQWCQGNTTGAELLSCLTCLHGAAVNEEGRHTRWAEGTCECETKWFIPIGQPVAQHGCKAAEERDYTADCAPFREPNQPECRRCLRECGPNARWTDANGGQCFNGEGRSVKSWEGCTPAF